MRAFEKDLEKIYSELERRNEELNGYYTLLDDEHPEASMVVDNFLEELALFKNKESIMATLTRIVSLKEDSIHQILKNLNYTNEEIIESLDKGYLFVKEFHLKRHLSLIDWIDENKLLSPFYRTLIRGVHDVGVAISEWQDDWTTHIIHGINIELSTRFNGDDDEVFRFLNEKELLQKDKNNQIADRSYSVLVKDNEGEYKMLPYAQAFASEVDAVVCELSKLLSKLEILKDDIFHQKAEWINYLHALKLAFAHTKDNELIDYWANVDRAWMKITTPIQIGHPLEYYEDHYRKAVALEWDLRISSPKLQSSSHAKNSIKLFFSHLAHEIGGEETIKIMYKNLKQIDETQLYIGQPILFYGAEFNGLFSAQVVPNDEIVSSELGKKIFAYADFVLNSKKSKPIMKLAVEIMGLNFVKKQREIMENTPDLWHRLYDISTIGHEFGHILWIDSDTESVMNITGGFKNIEEFKATTGGIMAFFNSHHEAELKELFIDDLVARAVGLMGWREVGEVLPYYCEGLIHLHILFKSGIMRYNNRVIIDYSAYDKMKQCYKEVYKALSMHYLAKEDANICLSHYATKKDNVYLPVQKEVKEFVEHYYRRYKEIGICVF
ncbi:MAG: invasion protein CiaB [Sulfurovum sp.]|nr:MAG: invasion protein CiaB [Sulfurovum sp.]